MGRKAGCTALSATVALAAAGCGGGAAGTHTTALAKTHKAAGATASSTYVPVKAPLAIQVSSPGFANGGRIPSAFTCAGADTSPPLRFANVPAGAKTLALLMVDPDAPGGPFTHWALANIASTTRALKPGSVPAGAIPGQNGFGKTGYGGPCPPAGSSHHYVIELLALPRRVTVSPGFASGVLSRLRPVAAGVLRGAFSRR